MTCGASRGNQAFFACAFLFSALATWSEAACAVTNFTAEQIVKKNVIARGGLQAWKEVRSMTVSGRMDAGKIRSPAEIRMADPRKPAINIRNARAEARTGEATQGQVQPDKVLQLPFVMELKRPRKMRLEVVFQGETAIQVYDGVQGWKMRPFLGQAGVESFSREELATAAQQQELDGFLIDHAEKGSRIDLAGQESVEGRNTYKLKLTLKSGDVRYLWIDASTFLETRIDGVRKMDGKPKTMMTYYRDYKPVSGLMFPHVFETRVEGVRDSQRIIVEHVALNPAIVDTRFTKPQ
jgi:hypothetical protein